jgi:two-component system chemotaxis response regulator CheB
MQTNPPRADELAPPIVAIGASGSEGLIDLRAKLRAVVLVVLHRPSDQISHLREVLAARSALPVVIPDDDQEFRVGVCYIGEPAAHLSLAARSRAHLIKSAQTKYPNRTVDLLFTSVAAQARARAIGVVLRGSLSDGSRGLAAIHFAGGSTMVLGTRGILRTPIALSRPITDAKRGAGRSTGRSERPADILAQSCG